MQNYFFFSFEMNEKWKKIASYIGNNSSIRKTVNQLMLQDLKQRNDV